jgi:hypothetical protein
MQKRGQARKSNHFQDCAIAMIFLVKKGAAPVIKNGSKSCRQV